MKPKMNLFFLAIMLAAILSVVGSILVIVIMPFWLFYLCSSPENTMLWSIAKRRSAKAVMDKLTNDYGLNPKTYTGNKYKTLFPKIISDALTEIRLSNPESSSFTTVRDEFFQVFSSGMIWNAKSSVAAQSNQKSYKRLKSCVGTSKSQRKVDYQNAFSVICKDYRIWVYPYFIILETRSSFKLYNWSDFECIIDVPVLLKENGVIQNKFGVQPYSIQYLHSNKDGSPDRRYNSNPCSMMYLFTPLVMKFRTDEITLIALRNEEATRIQSAIAFYRSNAYSVNSCENPSQSRDAEYDPESITNTIICRN